MVQRLPIYMEDVPEYAIKGDHMHICWRDLELVLPVHVMLAGMGAAKREIDKWQRQSAEVIGFPPRQSHG